MSESKKTQWHPPFCAAMKLELKDNKKDLSFESELPLNTKPIQLDLLVIKKQKKAIIQNEVGRIFQQHNLFEYKSPEDGLGIDVYFKTPATDKDDKENADSVFQLALAENETIFNKLKEIPEMNEALIKLMKPELDAATANAKNECITKLSEAAKRLKQGSSEKKLLDEGFDPDIVKSANELLAALS